MNRIYLRHVDSLLQSDSRSRCFLAYLKLRISTKNTCGGFYLKDLQNTLQVSDTSARKTINNLLLHDYCVKISHNYYRIISFKSIIGDNLHEKFFKITDKEVFSYSWKNISSFRALLVELRNQTNRNMRKKLRKGFWKTDRHGVKEKISSQSNKEFDTLMASTYVCSYTHKSQSTIIKYRKKQTLVIYSQEYPELVKKDFLKNKGKFFTINNSLIYCGISTRYGSVKLNGY
jgi:hypothetical protein